MAENKRVAPENFINLKVLGQDDTILIFKMRKHTSLKKMMISYCERTGLNMATLRFLFRGQFICESDTPSSLEMEELDIIYVYDQQNGGSGDVDNKSINFKYY